MTYWQNYFHLLKCWFFDHCAPFVHAIGLLPTKQIGYAILSYRFYLALPYLLATRWLLIQTTNCSIKINIMKQKSFYRLLIAVIFLLSGSYGFSQKTSLQDLIRQKEQHTQDLLTGKIQPRTSADRLLVMGPEQDCGNAIAVCNNSYQQNSSYEGGGNVVDFAPGTTCLSTGETNSVWYTFTVNQSGTFTFTINTQNDYDFALYDLTNSDCSQIPNLTPVRCNYSATQGSTGLTLPTAGGNISNSASGSPFMPGIDVVAGQRFALIINNYTANANGYSVNFGGANGGGGTAAIFDNVPPRIISTAASCTGNTITVTLSEPVLCSSVNNSNFTISALSGGSPATITSIVGVGCGAGNNTCTQVQVTYSGGTANGNYALVATGNAANALRDACGNTLQPVSVPFSKLFPFSITATEYCIGGPAMVLKLNPVPPAGSVVTWSTGQTGNSISVSPTATTTYTATVSLGNCRQAVSYTINPVPCDPCVLANNKPKFSILSTIYNSLGQATVTAKDFSTTSAASFPYVKWSWGDGSPLQTAGPGATVNHTYAQPGTYNICLHMYTFPNDSTCCHDSTCRTVVIPPPSCAVINSSFSITYPTLCATGNCCVKVTHSSFYAPADIVWEWGDGTFTGSGTTQTATHTYPADGWYTITMYVTYRAPWNPELCCYKKVQRRVCIYNCSRVIGRSDGATVGSDAVSIPAPSPCDVAVDTLAYPIVTDIGKDEYVKAFDQAALAREVMGQRAVAPVAALPSAKELRITATPNPAGKKVTFSVGYEKAVAGTITIYNLKGVALVTIKANSNTQVDYNLAALSPGVYLYGFSAKGLQSATQRLVVTQE
jgi:Secretion system C-terminal sorting domain/PKD domain